MITTASRTADDFLTGGGEIGALIRAHDWSATPLGPMDRWPQSLKTSLGIMLTSRHPMFVFWGPDLVKIYNDAYRPITGEKHPWALGRPASEVWPEIWSDIKPLVDRALAGDATWSDDFLLFMHRNGFPEEVFFTFSYSPIPDESGGVGGMFCACTETTGKVLGERRLRALRDLAARPAEARTVVDACVLSAEVLTRHAADVPFALIYLLEAEGTVARLMAAAGVSPGEPACPVVVTPDDAAAGWPLFRVAGSRRPEEVRDLHARFAALPAGPWPEPPSVAMVLPVIDRGLDQAVGLVILGISARRLLDDEYRGWCQLVASQIGASIANARASEEERKRAEALAELDRAKTAFFTNVSHEFRTPLTLMLGPLEEILGQPGRVSAESRELLTVAHRNGLRLLKLVNALLDFSRIEAGRSQAVYEPKDLAALTADLASNFRSACERAGLSLRVECPSLPAPVHVDRDMWEKIVLNLLSNALKFTFDGEIAVTLRAVGDHVELAVRDTGIGIAAEEIPHLFDRFYRVKGVRARTHEGTGIGLSLVQELVRLHGGAVRVESLPGQGSTFAVTVPTGTAHLPAERIGAPRSVTATSLGAGPFLEEALRWLPDAEPAERLSSVTEDRGGVPVAPPGRRPRILWADDNADMRNYVSRLLGEHWTVEAVADGRAALEAARARVPDLVLADVMMPGLDGFELLQALRGDPRTATVPVILLSARAGGEAHVEGLQAGADDYIVKPFTARELIARIRTHLTLTRLRQETTREAQEARVEAEAANRAKDVFLAMLSHELRQPMSSIVTWVRMLQRGGLGADARQQGLATLERNVHALTRLIDDVLDVSAIVTGKLQLRLQPVDLRQPLEAAVEVTRPAALAKSIDVQVAVDPTIPAILGDPDRLQQIVWNLLSNAVKFTPDGGRVTVRMRRTASRVVLDVTDSGRGIRPEFLPRIFERFSQAGEGPVTAGRGLGLGLAIVRHLVELHGGSVSVESPGEGRGATFTVSLPLTSG